MRFFALFTVLAALSTTAHAKGTCTEDDRWGCLHAGDVALKRGDRATALDDFSAACRANLLDGCLSEGRLRVSLGDLDGAEPPLRRVQAEDRADGYEAMADLYDARANHAAAEQLRWDGLAIEQPDAEFIGSYRLESVGTTASANETFVLDLRIHPMAFDSRRVTCGLELVMAPAFEEAFATVGLQHFVTPWLVLYGDALVGGRRYGFPLDAGVQGGIELVLGPIGHLDIGLGSTFASPLHFSFGLGLDWLIALEAAMRAA